MNTLKVARVVALGVAVTAGWGGAVGAETKEGAGLDGGPFLTLCEPVLRKPTGPAQVKDVFQTGYCHGFVDAAFGSLVMEAAEARRADTGLCPKDDSGDPLLLLKVVLKYLKENPKTHAQPAEVPIRAALRKAFPCR